MFGNNNLRLALEVGIVLLVNFLAKDEHHQVGVLFDGAGLAQVGELRTMIASTALGGSAQLRERDHRHAEFFGEAFQSARNCRHFLRTIFVALASA